MTSKRSFKELLIIAFIFVCSFILAYIYPPLGIHMVLIAIIVSLLVVKKKNY